MNEKVKALPYGISGFVEAKEKNRYCVDKSMFLSKLETAGDFLFLIRPRRFGKSMFLSMMQAYYNMGSQDRFDFLFDGMAARGGRTGLKGKFQVMYFDFSQAAAGPGDLETQFHEYCSD